MRGHRKFFAMDFTWWLLNLSGTIYHSFTIGYLILVAITLGRTIGFVSCTTFMQGQEPDLHLCSHIGLYVEIFDSPSVLDA